MGKIKAATATMAVMLLCMSAFAQLEWQVGKLPNASITINGDLSESYWAGATKFKEDQSDAEYGVVDGDADCYVEWVNFWDDNAFYFLAMFHDDFHNAPHSMFLADANNGYDDDGFQFIINHSFDDAWNTADPGHGVLGWGLVKGFGNDNPEEQYGGMWDTRNGTWYTEYWTKDDERNKGWDNVFVSLNGVDYAYESAFRWSSEMLRNSTPTEGKTLAFGVVVNDNDGGFSVEGQIRQGFGEGQLTGTDGRRPCHKAILGAAAAIRPNTGIVRFQSIQTAGSAAYDVLGRRMVGTPKMPSHLSVQKQAASGSRIVVR
jgi:hypothetical protein